MRNTSKSTKAPVSAKVRVGATSSKTSSKPGAGSKVKVTVAPRAYITSNHQTSSSKASVKTDQLSRKKSVSRVSSNRAPKGRGGV